MSKLIVKITVLWCKFTCFLCEENVLMRLINLALDGFDCFNSSTDIKYDLLISCGDLSVGSRFFIDSPIC